MNSTNQEKPAMPFTVTVRRLTFVRKSPGLVLASLETDGDIPNDRIAEVFRLALGAHQGEKT